MLPLPIKYCQILLSFFLLSLLSYFLYLNRLDIQSISCMLEEFLDAGNKLVYWQFIHKQSSRREEILVLPSS